MRSPSKSNVMRIMIFRWIEIGFVHDMEESLGHKKHNIPHSIHTISPPPPLVLWRIDWANLQFDLLDPFSRVLDERMCAMCVHESHAFNVNWLTNISIIQYRAW